LTDEQRRRSLKGFKVVTLIGTRPELIKLSRVIAELDRTVAHILVHTGQNHAPELSTDLFSDLGIRRADRYLEAAGASAVETMAQCLLRFDDVLASEMPDAVLFYGDTDSGLAVLAAKRRKIPIFHMEAGNRCYDQTVPEEVNRRLLDHLSDINMPLSEHARRCLLAEGLAPDRIIKTGSPMAEVLLFHQQRIDQSDATSRLGLGPGGYILASVHRAENVDGDAALSAVSETLKGLAGHFGLPVVVSTHPRTRARLERNYPTGFSDDKIAFHPPFPFTDYVKLQKDAFCVVSDSGSLTEEASILDLPAVALRRQHERPEGMDEGTVVMAGIARDSVIRAVALVSAMRRDEARSTRLVDDYTATDVSRKVVRAIVSYTDYVRRTVWKQDNG
jgi:UDP-N-acetylglucosamine 2-epimerase (non-hydrolysing)